MYCAAVVQLLRPCWTVARQAPLSFTVSRSLLKFMSIESVMTSNQLILCCPLLLQPSILPSIRVFPNELALHIKWPVCLCVCVYIYITHCMICMIYMMYDQTSSTIFWLIFLLILDPGGPVCVYECGWQERGTV